MANKNLFKSASAKNNKNVSKDTGMTVNLAGGNAYKLGDEEALAQLALTGTFNNTFYASGDKVLNEVISRVGNVRPEFLARLAVYSREKGFMKDASALLLAVLMVRDIELFKKVFNRVIDNGKMLKNFCQIVRSGKVGRRSFGTAAKRCIQNWLDARNDRQILEDSIGNDPSLADVIKMVHPKPRTKSREAFYAYLLGKNYTASVLPENVSEFEAFKAMTKGNRTVPNVPFQLLTGIELSDSEWKSIFRNMKWHALRMNLNTAARHGVFSDSELVTTIAQKLASPDNVRGAKVFPYQLFTAYHTTAENGIPTKIGNALQDAMETATENVPAIPGKVIVGVDCSGSMSDPITGSRGNVSTKVNCNMVASLMAACVVRNNPNSEVYRFDDSAKKVVVNPRDSVMTNASKIGTNGGGTDCASLLRLLNAGKAKSDVVMIISDNQSWVQGNYGRNKTPLMHEWENFKKYNPNAKLILIDIAPYVDTQALSAKGDVLNVGGFSDTVFEVVSAFLEQSASGNQTSTKEPCDA